MFFKDNWEAHAEFNPGQDVHRQVSNNNDNAFQEKIQGLDPFLPTTTLRRFKMLYFLITFDNLSPLNMFYSIGSCKN